MTFECASEIVSAVCNSDCDNQVCYDLFDHFVKFFNIQIDDERALQTFASMCGFVVVGVESYTTP